MSGPIECGEPGCDRTFEAEHGRAVHRSRTHGIKGTSRAPAVHVDTAQDQVVEGSERQAGDDEGREVTVTFTLDGEEPDVWDALRFLYGWEEDEVVCIALDDLFTWARSQPAVEHAIRALREHREP